MVSVSCAPISQSNRRRVRELPLGPRLPLGRPNDCDARDSDPRVRAIASLGERSANLRRHFAAALLHVRFFDRERFRQIDRPGERRLSAISARIAVTSGLLW